MLAQIRQMQSEPSPLVAAQQRKAEAVVDTEKFQLLIENLQVEDDFVSGASDLVIIHRELS